MRAGWCTRKWYPSIKSPNLHLTIIYRLKKETGRSLTMVKPTAKPLFNKTPPTTPGTIATTTRTPDKRRAKQLSLWAIWFRPFLFFVTLLILEHIPSHGCSPLLHFPCSGVCYLFYHPCLPVALLIMLCISVAAPDAGRLFSPLLPLFCLYNPSSAFALSYVICLKHK